MSHNKKHKTVKNGGFWEKILHKKKPIPQKELQLQREALRRILFEERKEELEELKRHEELKSRIECKRQGRKEKIREILKKTSVLLQNLTIPKKIEITKSKNFEECYINMGNAREAIAKHNISGAKNLYIEARNVYIDLSYEEKKGIYKELMRLYKQLAK